MENQLERQPKLGQFGPDKELLEKLWLRFQAIQEQPLVVTLSEEEAILKPNPHLLCPVCENVVWDTTVCQKCDRHFCTKCIDSWTKKNNSCPNCRDQPFERGKVVHFVKNSLADLNFKCKKCDENFKYEKSMEHVSRCQRTTVCLLNCGDTQYFSTFETLVSHMQDSCPNMQLECATCQEKFVRETGHSCNAFFQQKIDQLEQSLLQKDFEFMNLSYDYKKQLIENKKLLDLE